MDAQETIIVGQNGGLDGILIIQADCGESGLCLEAVNQSGINGEEWIEFQAPSDGTYFIILKAYSATPNPTDYNFFVFHLEDPLEQTCDDEMDNDQDGLVDCSDPDCFGTPSICDTETNCGDHQDNDGDGAIDCFDSECSGVTPCGYENSVDRCVDGLDNDADGLTDCDDPNCSSFPLCIPGQSCFSPIPITSFPYNVSGLDYRNDFSNNYNFGNPPLGCSGAEGAELIFTIILQAGERILLDYSGALYVVKRIMEVCSDTNPVCLISNDQSNVVFTAPRDGTFFIILEALYSGYNNGSIQYDFTISKVDATETSCIDGTDNDGDQAVDCDDSDCFGAAGSCISETNCADGSDNDDDNLVDCDDTIDCSTFVSCISDGACNDSISVSSFPFTISGTNFVTDYPNNHNFSSVSCKYSSGSEVTFSVNLQFGQRLKMEQSGIIRTVTRVMRVCTATSPYCQYSDDDPYNNVPFFTVPADGVYFVNLEAVESNPTLKAYNFTMSLFDGTETSCTDGIDNDGNDSIDCADPVCFEHPTCPDILYSENFNTWPPVGWTILDGGAPGFTWFNSENMTSIDYRILDGSTGNFALVDSNAVGTAILFDEQLISPCFDFSGHSAVFIAFRNYYFDGSSSQSGTVDVTTNDGLSWTTLITYDTPYSRYLVNGAFAYLNISPQAAGQSNVKIRFHYLDSNYGAFWLIDDFIIMAD